MAAKTWLRSTVRGTCVSNRSATAKASCSTDDTGLWLLPATPTFKSWEQQALTCLLKCDECTRCNYISLSLAQDQCTWHHACTALKEHDYHRTGRREHVGKTRQHADQMESVDPKDALVGGWLRSSMPGACHVFPDQIGDCNFGDSGRFSLFGPHLDSMEAAISGCLPECAACPRCRFLSVSLTHRSCAWFHQCNADHYRQDGQYGGVVFEQFRTSVAASFAPRAAVDLRQGLDHVLNGTHKGIVSTWQLGRAMRWLRRHSRAASTLSRPRTLIKHLRNLLDEWLAWNDAQRRLKMSRDFTLAIIGLHARVLLHRADRATIDSGTNHASVIQRRPSTRLLLVTPTYPHVHQMRNLRACAHVLQHDARRTGPLIWIVAEDASTPSANVSAMLRAIDIEHVHLATGPTYQKGNQQRAVALDFIRERGLQGIVYNMDEDNLYAPQLWTELRRVSSGRVGVLPVQLDQFSYSERPYYDQHGRFRGFTAGWCYDGWFSLRFGPRLFCVDMGGFAFDSALLRPERAGAALPRWNYTGRTAQRTISCRLRRCRRFRSPRGAKRILRGGETEFISQLLPSGYPEDLQPLANCGHDVLVYHNGLSIEGNGSGAWQPIIRPAVKCKADGWWGL